RARLCVVARDVRSADPRRCLGEGAARRRPRRSSRHRLRVDAALARRTRAGDAIPRRRAGRHAGARPVPEPRRECARCAGRAAYVTNLAASAVQVIDHDTVRTIASGPDFAWPDTLAWDDRGNLYITTNHLNHGFAGTLDFTRTNFRIFRIHKETP